MKLAGYERYVVAPTCLMQNFRKLHSCFLHQHSQIRFIFLVRGHSERHIEKLLSSSTLRLHRIKYCLEQPNQEYLKNIRKKKRRRQSVCWRWEKEKRSEAAGQSVQKSQEKSPDVTSPGKRRQEKLQQEHSVCPWSVWQLQGEKIWDAGSLKKASQFPSIVRVFKCAVGFAILFFFLYNILHLPLPGLKRGASWTFPLHNPHRYHR